MTISQIDRILFIPKRVLALIAILLVFVPIIANFHHHEDGEERETCLICIIIENLLDCFIPNLPTIVQPAIFHFILISYIPLYPNVTLSSYHCRSPPLSFFASIDSFYI